MQALNICKLTIFQWGNNEVKCAIIKVQNVNAADDYDQTFNCKWSNITRGQGVMIKKLWCIWVRG